MGWSERCLLRNDSDTALYDQEGSSNDLRRNTAGRRCLWRAELGDTVQRSDVCLEHGGRGAGSGEETGTRHTGPYGSYSSCTVGLGGEF